MREWFKQVTPLHIIGLLVLGVASASHLMGLTSSEMLFSFIGGTVLGVGGALAKK